MKRFALLVIGCVVVGQTKVKEGFKTECKGTEENGFVIFDKKVPEGKEAIYKPYGIDGDYLRGMILEVGDPKPVVAQAESSSEGKAP